MHQVLVRNLSNPSIQPLQVRYCDTFACRLRGLTFHRSLPSDQGLLLVQSRDSRLDAAIHMLGVFIELAVVWINQPQQVVDVRLARPWRPIYVPERPARYVLEIAPAHLNDFEIGDNLRFEEFKLE